MSIRSLQALKINKASFSRVFKKPHEVVTFTTTTSRHAKKIIRSPTVRALERAKKQGASNPAQDNVTPHWPLGLLEESYKSSVLAIPSSTAAEVLDQFQALGRRPGQQAVQKLCTDWDIKPATLYMLANILMHSGYAHHNTIALDLLIAASKQNEATATFQLIQRAIKEDQLQSPDLVFARQHLDHLAAANNPDALMTLGIIREKEGDFAKSLALFKQAYSIATDVSKTSNGLILTNIGRLHQHLGDTDSAKAALEKAALLHEDPNAYFLLTMYHISPASPNYLSYMLKAAASGVPTAAHELGLFYLAESFGMLPLNVVSDTGPASLPNRAIEIHSPPPWVVTQKLVLAMEWLTISATVSPDCISISQLYLAILLRTTKDDQKAREWLDQAGKDPERARLVEIYKAHWYDNDSSFLTGINLRDGKSIEGINGLPHLVWDWVEKGKEKGKLGGDQVPKVGR